MASIPSQVYRYNRTFSGTDTLAFILLPGCVPVVLGSVTTISYSMFRNKKPVINIGRTNINGVTRGSRIFAGTMVFTVINQHWLREVVEQDTCKDWLGKVPELKADELPLFDIMLVAANEYGAYCSMFIYGIDITDEAQTLSIEDMFTENTLQFVARDLSTFESTDTIYNSNSKENNINPMLISESRLFFETSADYNETKRDKILETKQYEKAQNERPKEVLTRDLYENTSRYFVGNDVLEVQVLLNRARIKVNETGVFDNQTANAVREFQSLIGENVIDGIVDTRLYQQLLSYVDSDRNNTRGYVINKAGTYVYKERNMYSDVQNIIPYKETLILSNPDNGTDGNLYYETDDGYVLASDVFNINNIHGTVEIPTLRYNDSSAYVTKLQEALNTIYNARLSSNRMDSSTINFVKRFQRDNDLEQTGVVDNDTWLAIETQAGSGRITTDGTDITFTLAPGTYSADDLTDYVKNLEITIRSDNSVSVKSVATSKYTDNSTQYNESFESINGSKKLDRQNLINSTLYNVNKGNTPNMVEYIVYPYNMEPYKWIFTSKGA